MTAPDEGTLRRFLLGQLPAAEAGTVEAFIETHPEMSAVLDQLTAADPFVSALRGRTGDPAVSPEAEALARRLEALSGEPTRSAANDSSADFSGIRTEQDEAAFLAPPQGPGELGRLGDFRVLCVLGRGGMGVVFEAEDTRLGRRVAIKAMLPKIAADPMARQRFLREAKAAAAVEHDHVVAIHHIEESNGVPFLVMPFLKGESLDDRLKRLGTLSIAEVVRIGREIAEGLAAAHAQGLVHRDIKPANLWLESPKDRVRILDFGLARPAETGPGTEITQSGAVVGTPAYMSPEQGRGQAVDFRTDLFSLGGVLYRACTGRTPFHGADTASMLMALAADTPVDPRRLNPKVPGPLAGLILQLLEKDPARRPPSAREVASRLSPAVEALPAGNDGPRPEFEFDGDETEVVPTAMPVAKRRRVGRWIGVAAVVLVLGFGLLFAPTIIRIATNKGELVIEVDDPNIEVLVKPDAAYVQMDKGKTTEREFVLKAGGYEVEFFEPASGAGGLTKKFEIKRGGTIRLKATMAEVVAARKTKPNPAGTSSPAGLAWTGEKPPPKDLLAGDLVYYETFDDPKTVGALPAVHSNTRPAVEGGALVLEPKPGEAINSCGADVGPTATDLGFVARLKADRATTVVSFRNRNTPTRRRWLVVEVTPVGRWTLTRSSQDLQAGKWENKDVILAWSAAADPELAAGKWVTVTGRAVGLEYELWLNGKRVAHGSDDDGFVGPNTYPAAIQLIAQGAGDGRARFAVDYVAVWKLSGEAADPDRRPAHRAGGDWRMDGAELVQATPGKAMLMFGDPAWTDYDLTVETKTAPGVDQGQGALLYFRATAPDNYMNFNLGSYGGSFDEAAFLRNGKWGQGAAAKTPHLPDRWYKMRVEVRGKHVRCSLDGKPQFEFENDQFPAGRVGLGTWNTAVRWRNLKVTAPDGKVLYAGFPAPPAFTNTLGMEFALVPMGKAWLGGGGGKPGDREVEFRDDFHLGAYPVTQEEWEKVMGSNPAHFSRDGVRKNDVKDVPDADLKRFPVEGVSFADVEAFLARLNEKSKDAGWVYRLPTSDEWEYACRGGPVDKAAGAYRFYVGEPSDDLPADRANYAHPGGLNRTIKVGQFPPNRLGLYDMHALVIEWCSDRGRNAIGAETRLCRGGSWNDPPCFAESHLQFLPTVRYASLGLRVVRVQAADANRYRHPLGIEFIRVPKGKGWVADKETAVKDDFYLGAYEVTQEQWEKVMGKNPSHFSRTGAGKDAVKDVSDTDLKRFPVENVSRDDAELFLRRLNEADARADWEYRLPTQAQWEYACRGGPGDRPANGFDYYFDRPADRLSPDQANYKHDGGLNRTCRVGLYPPNRLGLYDMHGNVTEWTAENLPGGGVVDTVVCGGSWNLEGEFARAGQPYGTNHGYRGNGGGLRVARVRTAASAGPAGWAGEAPPPKDLFAGKPETYETFDDPKSTKWFQGTKDGVTFAVEKGAYVVTAPAAVGRATARLGPPAENTAFAVRLRGAHLRIVSFRPRKANNIYTWTSLVVEADGQWELANWSSTPEGENLAKVKVIARSTRPDPDLAENKWVAVAAKSAGSEVEVWLNGVAVAKATVVDPPAPAGTTYAPVDWAVSCENQPPDTEPFRIEIDHVAIWKLPDPAPKK